MSRKSPLSLNPKPHSTTESTTWNCLVVVHTDERAVVKGTLQWDVSDDLTVPALPLPDVLHIQHESAGTSSMVRLSDAKAVFLVRSHEGDPAHEEMKFLLNPSASDLWIQVRLLDGEVLEGRTDNSIRLLCGSGFWLRPTDCTANNVLVYVPKTSAVEFHVMGVETARKQVESASV